MSSIYLNPQPSSSPIPFQDFKGDQLIGQIHDLASSSTSLSYTNLEMIHSYEESLALEYSRHPQEIKVNNFLSLDKPNNIGHMLQSSAPSAPWPQTLLQDSSSGSSSYVYSYNNHDDGRNKMLEHVTTNSSDHKYTRRSWKPSKVRIMQKMMMGNNSKDNMGEQKLHLDLKQQQGNITKIGNSNNNEGNNGIRVCSDCHTTTTPLWRSGPLGPKSLCNACGIRQRKARRAAMAAAAAASSGFNNDGVGTPMCVEPPKSEPRDQEVLYKTALDNTSHPLPHKKRGKIVNASKNYVGNNSYNNNNNGLTTSSKDYITTTTSQRVFPRDEEEGAILLMALSCGLACSS